MILCTKCGHRNPDGTQFCQGCQSYLEWSGTRVDEVPRSALVVGLPAEARAVEAGAEAVVDVEVRNTGTIVDAFDVEVTGPDAAWITPDPAQLRLFPRSSGMVRLRLAPPRDPLVAAGAHEYSIRVTSATDPRVGAEERGQVDVAAFRELTARLVPTRAEAVTSTEHRLEVVNRGNVPVEVRFAPSDPDEALQFELRPPPPYRLGPGGTGVVQVVVTARRPLAEPQSRSWPFRVAVEASGAPAVAVDGVMVQEPPPAPRLGARLVPVQSEGISSATHRLELINESPVALDARVLATDPDEGLHLEVLPPGPFRFAPQATYAVQLLVTPLRPLDEPRPRNWPFRVVVEAMGAEPVTVEGVMAQLPAPAARVTARLVPVQSEGAGAVTHRLEVANEGNLPVDVRAQAAPTARGLMLDVQARGVFRLAPGESRMLPVVVIPRHRVTGDRPRTWSFQVRLEPAGLAPVAVDGIMVQHRPDPSTLPPRRGCGCWIALAAVLALVGGSVAAAYYLVQNGTLHLGPLRGLGI
jgi:hypothetical protein